MTKNEMLDFIFSKPEWKDHFIECHNKLNNEVKSYCICKYPFSSFSNPIDGVTKCNRCDRVVSDWNPSKKKSDIASTILSEEQKFQKLIEEKEPLLLSLKNDLTGEVLSWLHQTHGMDNDLVEDILCIKLTSEQKEDYIKFYNIHKTTGLKGFKPKIISAKVI